MKRTAFIFLAMLVISTAVQAHADAPRTINYQGRLTDLSGIPLADGEYSVAVRLYLNAADLEGSSIWSDNYTVATKNGYFNVVLGSTPSFPLNLTFDRQYYLGIKVGTDAEMTPRQPLNSVPYALNASSYVLPIGIILAWHKSMSGTPGLPPTYAECNGQILNDPESPYNGQVIPNLNGDPSGENSPDMSSKASLFLRGGTTSGTGQNDAFQGHKHNSYSTFWYDGTGGSIIGDPGVGWGIYTIEGMWGYSADSGYGTPRIANETRPKNMSVIWIMKVK